MTMTNSERHAWAAPTPEALARGIGLRQLSEDAREGLVTSAIRAFSGSIGRRNASAQADFATEVAKSKGDVQRVPGYDNLRQSIEALRAIDDQSGGALSGPNGPLRVAASAHEVLLHNRKAFQDSFRGQAGTGRYVYQAMVLALFGTVSLIIAECVSWPQGGGDPAVSQTAAQGVAESIPVQSLERLLARATKAGFATTLSETAELVEQEVLGEFAVGLIPTFLAGAGGLAFLLWMARNVTEWFFGVRKRFAAWLELQARFLELNAERLRGERSADSRQKQEGYASSFRALADRVRVENAQGSREAQEEIRSLDQDLSRSVEGTGTGGYLA